VFARDASSGLLTPAGHVGVPAKPRYFALTPDGRWLLCAGQGADAVVVFAVQQPDGSLTQMHAGVTSLATPKPVCLYFVAP
jgi:6-phosphogluconolactonase